VPSDNKRKFSSSFSKGETIYWEGDLGKEMYVIKSGKVSLIREMGDGEITLSKLGASEFFGVMALFGEPKRKFSARALTNCELTVISSDMLKSQFKKLPEWLVAMMKTIANRIISTEKGVRTRFKIGIEYSILKTIFLLKEGLGVHEEKGMVLDLKILRYELTEILGISYDDIDNWLKKFNFVNLLKVYSSKNQLLIPDPERVNLFAEYLHMKTFPSETKDLEIDHNAMQAFERIHKLLSRY